ncbi:hypothetical protein PVL29_021204 [Vitis rotundifolia]|uniref:Uncharacterized protein n=1 Tax=Vitis rotundifolia TaxID=103349 RepID=A0AA38YZ71_VITRO|nr:hypothetical protein PVL29_021204 [Vitis rotundifolia]
MPVKPLSWDHAWWSESETFQKQHSMDSASLASTLTEIQKLSNQRNHSVLVTGLQYLDTQCGTLIHHRFLKVMELLKVEVW